MLKHKINYCSGIILSGNSSFFKWNSAIHLLLYFSYFLCKSEAIPGQFSHKAKVNSISQPASAPRALGHQMNHPAASYSFYRGRHTYLACCFFLSKQNQNRIIPYILLNNQLISLHDGQINLNWTCFESCAFYIERTFHNLFNHSPLVITETCGVFWFVFACHREPCYYIALETKSLLTSA